MARPAAGDDDWRDPQKFGSLAEHDMVRFTVGEDDVRIARGDWIFYVHAVRWPDRLIGDSEWRRQHGGNIGAQSDDPLGVGAAFNSFVANVWHERRRRSAQTWRVGVLRRGSPGSFRVEQRWRILSDDRLDPDADLATAIAERVSKVNAGDYDETGPAR